jgi:acetylornithine aminotransferase
MVGATLDHGLNAVAVAARALDAGLVINVPGPGVLRFLPPLVIGEAEVDEALEMLRHALS